MDTMDAFQVSEEETQVNVGADCDFEDEEMFSNDSYTSTTASDFSPISSNSPQTAPSYASPPPQFSLTLPIRQVPVQVYTHAQCGHAFQASNFPDISIQLLEPANIQHSRSPSSTSNHHFNTTNHIHLLNPRSCTLCTFHESQRIIASTNHTCDLIENSSIAEEYKDRAIAYQNGLEDGRLLALKKSLDWCRARGSERGGEVARAMEMLLRNLKDGGGWGSGLGWSGEMKRDRKGRSRKSFGSDESVGLELEIEEIAVLMQESSLRYCEAEYELRIGDELEEIEYLGKKDGIGLQGRRDEKAIRDRLF